MQYTHSNNAKVTQLTCSRNSRGSARDLEHVKTGDLVTIHRNPPASHKEPCTAGHLTRVCSAKLPALPLAD